MESDVVHTKDSLNYLEINGIDTSKIKIEDGEICFVNGSKLKIVETKGIEVVRSEVTFIIM